MLRATVPGIGRDWQMRERRKSLQLHLSIKKTKKVMEQIFTVSLL
jgi:hypothetical protein